MKAVVIREFGPPDVLQLEEVPDPTPDADEVLIAVHAVSINRSFDLLVRRDGNGREPTLPLVLGTDPSGEVVSLGEGVTGFQPGDRVVAAGSIRCGECRQCLSADEASCRRPRQIGVHLWGGYAEYVRLPAANVHRIPGGLPYAEATVILRHAPAAFHLLDDKAGLRPGEWVLVMGAAGALGSFCVQVAKLRGARVIAGAGEDSRVHAALGLGADFGVNYRETDLEREVLKITGGEGVDVVCENIADPTTFPAAFRSLAQNGRLVTMGAHGGGKVELDVARLYRRRLRVIGAAGQTSANIRQALAAGAEGKITALIDSILPLERAAEAHRRLERETPAGKIILDPTLAS